MNEKQVYHALHRISDQARPGEVDLWPGIRRRLRGPEPRRLRAPLRLNRALGLAVLVVMFGVVATALMQGIIDLDPGLRGERAADLVTLLGVSQERGGITVTLDWAYADANRLVLSYTVSGEAGEIEEIASPPEEAVVVTDSSGNSFPMLILVYRDASVPGMLTRTLSFDTRAVSGAPETLDLHVEVPVRRAVYTFDVTLPFLPAQFVGDPVAQTVDGLTVTLYDLRVTNTMTTLDLCYDAPDEQYWFPRLRLSFDDERVGMDLGSRYFAGPPQREGDRLCLSGGWFMAADTLPGRIRLEIPYLSTPVMWTRENAEALAEVWAGYGVRTEVADGGAAYTLNYPDGFPEGMDVEAIEAIIDEAVAGMDDLVGGERVTGPWVFTIDVP